MAVTSLSGPRLFSFCSLSHATIVAAILGLKGWAPVVMAISARKQREEMISGHASSAVHKYIPLDFLPDMSVYSPLPHRAEARDSSLLAGHVKSRIILESVTKEEGG